MIRFQCPTCAKILKVAPDGAGRRVTCPKCSAHIIVPPPVRRPAELGKALPDPEPEVTEDVQEVAPSPSKSCDSQSAHREKQEHEKYCHECGAIIRSKAVVCPQCGVAQRYQGGDLFCAPDGPSRPGKVTAIGIMLIVGGSCAIIGGLILVGSLVLLCWPGTYFAFFVGVWTIIDGCTVLSRPTGNGKPPTLSCILHIVNIINGNIISLVLGIICLVFLSDPQVKDWYYSNG